MLQHGQRAITVSSQVKFHFFRKKIFSLSYTYSLDVVISSPSHEALYVVPINEMSLVEKN